MNTHVILPKTQFNTFISKLTKSKAVVAPVSIGNNNFVFEKVTGGGEIALNYIPTVLPPKKYFMPKKEKISEYNKKEGHHNPVMEFDELIIFGVHTCDLAGIQCLNLVFSAKPKDINYLARKQKVTIIGLECNTYCDEYASCSVVQNHLPKGGYDLFLTELKDSFMIHVNTLEGKNLIDDEVHLYREPTVREFTEFEELRAQKRNIFKDEVNIPHKDIYGLFKRSFNSEVWDDLDKRCLSCGNCTNVCPTCYCFDIKDEINLDFNTGATYRVWDSCQNEEFAKVAGGENFRPERGARQRHRYMRKFLYPFKKFHRPFCTGCGRCTRTCMAKISLKETINALEGRR